MSSLEESNRNVSPGLAEQDHDNKIHDKNISIPQELGRSVPSTELVSNGTVYSSLQDSDEIRLLHLQPGTWGEMIKCSMEHAKFSNKPKYEALSYVWGTEDSGQTILIHGHTISVRQNLGLALQHLRLETETRVLWIDAICINQQNMSERNHQVQQMGEIYRQATKVAIWLGTSDSDSEVAFRVLSSPTKWCEYQHKKNTDDPAKDSEDDNELMAVLGLLSREYWTRLWIIQEFVLARKSVVICGDDKCSGVRLDWFMEFIKNWARMPRVIGQTQSHEVVVNAINKSVSARLYELRNTSEFIGSKDKEFAKRIKRNFTEPGPGPASKSLFAMFTEYETSKCEDRRDKIFGLHGMAKICCKRAVPINYSLSWEEILWKLVQHQITSHDCLSKSLGLDPASAVLRFQEFCQKKEELIRDPHQTRSAFSLDALESFGRSFTHSIWTINGNAKPYPVELRPYARGRVCYTSSPLDDLDLSKDCPIPPELTSMVHLQIDYICSLHRSQQLYYNPKAATEMDLVSRASFRGPRQTKNTIKLLAEGSIPYWGCNTHKQNDGATTSGRQDNFNQLLRKVQKSSIGTDLVLASEENGLVFLTSRSTRVGDLLCQFQESDVLVIIPAAAGQLDGYIDNYDQQYRFGVRGVSQGVNFLESPHGIAMDVCGKPMAFKYGEPYAIQLYVDSRSMGVLAGKSHTVLPSQTSWIHI